MVGEVEGAREVDEALRVVPRVLWRAGGPVCRAWGGCGRWRRGRAVLY